MEISFTTIDLAPFPVGGAILGLIVAIWLLTTLRGESIPRSRRFIFILMALLIAGVISIFGLMVGYMVAAGHAQNERAAAFDRLSSELGVEVVADSSVEDILLDPELVDVLSEPFTISYEIDGAVYQPTVVAKPVESSGNSHRFALYIQPGTSGELIELSADSLIAENELEEAR